MSEPYKTFGFGPDGKAFRVQAKVLPDRGRGALLGLAVGDALGTTLEFRTPAVAELPVLVHGPHVDVVGGGPFKLAAGQVTDDSQMAAHLAHSLMERGRYDVDDAAKRYAGWSSVAFDIGSQTADALGRVRIGDPPHQAGRETWEQRGHNAAGNGALMRITPVGLFFAQFDDDRVTAALDDAAITHFDPRCQLANAGFAAAIAGGAFHGEGARHMAARAIDGLDRGAEQLAERHPDLLDRVKQANLDLREDIRLAASDDPKLYSQAVHLLQHQGFVRVAFRLAFWHLLHTDDLRTALIDVVNRGGDADTNGAITGALLGAAHGEDAIPKAWRDTVLSATPPAPWNGETHPRAMLELVYSG